jgi:hypothetical protein
MISSVRITIIALLVLLFASPTFAIVRRHDRDDARYETLAKGQTAVVDLQLPGGAGTLIAPTWVVTAAHAAKLFKTPHRVKIDGHEYDVVRSVLYPDGDVGRDDIALIELASPVKNVTPATIYEKRDESPGMTVMFAGRGFSGDGITGPNVRDGKMRAATNTVHEIKKNWLTFVFDAPPAGTDLEGISGPGDSGGPAFTTEGGKTYLVGISSAQDSRATGKEGVYGVTEYYVRVSSYTEWLRNTMSSKPGKP